MIITLALLASPFVIDHRRRKKISMEMLRALKEEASKQGCELHKHEVHKEIGLGLDTHKKVLFVLNNNPHATAVRSVQLSLMAVCEAVLVRHGASAARPDAPIERVELHLKPKDRSTPDMRFVLYREATASLQGEVELAEKWSGLVNGSIRK